MTAPDPRRLFKRIGYDFQDAKLIELALTHRSCGSVNNERLEFLGDSILNFAIAEALFKQFPDKKEGELSHLRSQLVNGKTLAEIGREFDLGEYLILGGGELKSGGCRRESILADTVEALIGAIYLDAGIQVCQQCVLGWYASRLQDHLLEASEKDPKTQLQEFLQARRAPLPQYRAVEISGEAHAQQFTIECRVSLLEKPICATASNRRTAEKIAASLVLKQLQDKT